MRICIQFILDYHNIHFLTIHNKKYTHHERNHMVNVHKIRTPVITRIESRKSKAPEESNF